MRIQYVPKWNMLLVSKVYQVQVYNLDIILAVGYRTNSSRAIAFRQWATQTLKSHITKGYTINRHRIKTNYEQFLKAVDDVKSLLPAGSAVDNESVLRMILVDLRINNGVYAIN